jgi:DNA-binding response OmpR family regulator
MIPFTRPRVLVVEDDPDLLVVLRVNLESAGLEPILASDGSTAIARIEAERPDAVLLDMMLPGIDGWQVLADLHALGDPVPIVVCSAKKHPEDMERARELGAHAYIVKPFDIERLLDAVVDAVGHRAARHAEPIAEPRLSLDLAGLEPA